MFERLLNCNASDIAQMNRDDLLGAIRDSEGRIIMVETIGRKEPIFEVSNAEVVSAMSADILLLNIFDVDDPIINGLPEHDKKDTVRLLKKLTGRPIAINLEPAPLNPDNPSQWKLTPGRQATAANAKKALEMGVDMILITGNPGNGIENKEVIRAIRELKEAVGDKMIIAAGKMHAAGVDEEGADEILSMEEIDEFAKEGADIILLPAPGTVPGIDLSWARERVKRIHKMGKLACTAIGTSQEGSDIDTIKSIALLCKQTGADIHHIGDSGLSGITLPENILNYSIVIRGRRHTYMRMGRSINR
ncbi:MAG: haloacid dehalogenase-like hydrolase [Pseudobutyrivibrio sp.]|nr:haloacid dehalogenase-like hydrolase [Pseudobutyrivibrio sp.]